jgi:iron complex outermembrane recepter protein
MEELHSPRRSSAPRRARVLVSLLAAAGFAAHAWAAEVFHFDIPAGNAEETLLIVTRQTQFELLFETDKVRGVRTNAVSGDLEPQEAVRRMLEGTMLVFDAELRIVSRTEVPAPDPESGPGDARLRDILPPSSRGLPNLANSFANTDPEDLQEVVVTGTLIRGVFDIVSPLVMFGDSRIRRAGYGSVRDALQSLTMTFGGGPSEYFESDENFTRGAGIDLRGLGAGATLVLVNGRRQPFAGNDGNFVDVSSIPASAVKRVEVLPDGSSALYGSDAIAGVVNIIMRDDFRGIETQARVGLLEGGGDETVVSQLFGTSWSSGRMFMAYQYSNRSALGAWERDYAANSDKRGFGGTNFNSISSSPGNIIDLRTQQITFAIPAGQDGTALTVAQLLPGAINYTNRLQYTELFPDRQVHSLFASASQSVGERTELFGEFRLSDRVTEQMHPASERLLPVPASNPFNPFEVLVGVGYDFTNEFGRVSSGGRSRIYVGTLGMRKDIGESWKATLAATYGTERMGWTARNVLNPEALRRALADPNPETAFNPFGDGSANNLATIESIRESQHERAVSEVTTVNLVADGEVAELPAGAAKLAIGVDYREETLDHGMRLQQKEIGRRVGSTFTELALPIVGNAGDPRATPRLQLSLAARSEHYSDFGSTFNPKVGLQWVPTNSLKLRGSWGTSFKAPNLVDLYDDVGDRAGLASLRDALSPTGRSTALIRQGSNSELNEERAETWTAGIDFVPLPGSTLSLTFYSIRYDDRVFFLGPPLTPEQIIADSQWASLVTRNPSLEEVASICGSGILGVNLQQCMDAKPSILIDGRSHNLSATTVEGLDLDLDHILHTSRGAFTLGLHGSYMWRFEQELTDDSPGVEILNTVDNPVSLRLRGSVDWDQHGADQPGFGVGASVDHSGAYVDRIGPAARGIDPWTRVNLNLSYRLAGAGGSSGVEFILSGLNIFDEQPPFVDRDVGFDVANAEPFGRVVSFHLRKNW